MTAKLFLTAIVISFLLALPLRAAEVTAQLSEQGDKVIVKIDGKPFTEYVTKSNTRPILWPILGPNGKRMTRDYPMLQGTKETSDHVHHRSMWFAHGNVNGIDFWDEKPEAGLVQGTIVHRKFAKIASGPQAEIVTENDWLGPAGKKVGEDERRLTFGTWGDSRLIDFDITIRASEVPLVFNDTKEGTFGLRVAEGLRVDSKLGATIVNSNGLTNGAAWASRPTGSMTTGPSTATRWASPFSITPAASGIRPIGTCGPTACLPPTRSARGPSATGPPTRCRTRCRRARISSFATGSSCTPATKRKGKSPRPMPNTPS